MTAYDIRGLHLEEAGDGGPLLLCLHGIGSSSAAFAPQLAALADGFRVVAWDAPGYARSADPEHPLTMDDFADTAAEVIRARGGAAHVLGVSWGGVIALRLAVRHPGLVESLMICDSSPGSGTDPEKAAGMRARAEELARTGPEAFAAARAPRLVSPDAPTDLVRRVTATMAAAVRLPGYAHAAEAMASTDLRGELHRITAPTLVLCGDKDRITGPDGSQVLAGGLHKTAYVIVKDAGHLANQEQPERVNAWLASHLHIVTDHHAHATKG
ncbi:Pimeloyl-ACP methyl ester carboxylesterase [Streptomyces misionensis]|uniref:Pimeloyl-ACP methyl ester carboxylesterase n=1 Tax=Streptomyces misionensis TaxID=67331 RepID=A0A1H4M5D0_9ACTN|nr:alpha/beta fold hydrolase [Streptomyces misionensis]SEB77978.1 Pimeloyl-ACP methyl ester carboxylesterase [Streptomyces misionensis]